MNECIRMGECVSGGDIVYIYSLNEQDELLNAWMNKWIRKLYLEEI